MSDNVIDELPLTYSPTQPFPNKVVLKRLMIGVGIEDKNAEKTYYQRIYANVIMTMADDDNLVGNSKCSNCNNDVDIFIKFCPHCGAKIRGRIYYKNRDESNS